MNGKQAKAIRKALDIKIPTPSLGGYVYFDVVMWQWCMVRRVNPLMNMYRSIKRRYIRGEFRVKQTHRPSN